MLRVDKHMWSEEALQNIIDKKKSASVGAPPLLDQSTGEMMKPFRWPLVKTVIDLELVG